MHVLISSLIAVGPTMVQQLSLVLLVRALVVFLLCGLLFLARIFSLSLPLSSLILASLSHILPSSCIIHRPFPTLKMAFQNFIICATGLDPEEKQRAESWVVALSGKFSRQFIPGTITHLISTGHAANKGLASPKYAAAAREGIPIVTLQWVRDCHAQQRLLPLQRMPPFTGCIITVTNVGAVEERQVSPSVRQSVSQSVRQSVSQSVSLSVRPSVPFISFLFSLCFTSFVFIAVLACVCQ